MKNYGGPLIFIVLILMKYHELLPTSYSTNTIMASSLTGVHAVYGRSAYTCAIGITLPVSRRHCSIHQNTAASG
jgi:hypothetical protein